MTVKIFITFDTLTLENKCQELSKILSNFDSKSDRSTKNININFLNYL
ncbi:MAG: hypothetical protein WA865_11025 [Spirulinaceae cyanobacterium]